MNAKFKIALLSSVIVLGLTGCKEEQTTQVTGSTATATTAALPLETEIQKASYATGASFASLVNNIMKSENSELSSDYIISGFSETVKKNGRMSNEEINTVLVEYGKKLEEQAKVKLEESRKTNTETGDKFRKEFAAQEGVVTTDSGLMYKIQQEGTGEQPTESDIVEVHYVGKLVDGKEFDSSYTRNQTATFPLDGVIRGWTEGLQLIKEGGKITLVIPPDLAYGDNNLPGIGDRVGIGPQSTLVFDVELIKIKDEDEMDAAAEDDAANNGEEIQQATSEAEATAPAAETPAQ